MKNKTNLIGYTRSGILFLSLIFSALFNYSYSQYTIDGQNCVGTSIEWPATADAVDTGDPTTVNASSNIHRLWVNVHENYLQFAFTRESTTTGNATYAIYFDGDCDASTGETSRGGAEYAMIFNISSGDSISNTDVLYYSSGSYVSQGTSFTGFVGDSAVTTSCAGGNRNFFEFEIAAQDLFPDVCAIGSSTCGSVTITQMETLAGASPSSSAKDVMIADVEAFINDAPVVNIQPDPAIVCSGNTIDLTGAGSFENSTAARATSYDEVVKFEWDWDYNGTFSKETTGLSGTNDNTYTTPTLTNNTTSPIVYDVALKIEDQFGCRDSVMDFEVTVVGNPTASISAVTFDSTGGNWRCKDWVWTHEVDQVLTKDYQGNAITDFEWTMLNGAKVTGDFATYDGYTDCSHLYSANDIELLVTDANGCTATASFTIIPVPVDLVYFNGEILDGGAMLQWQTASELNSESFVIERSLDGNNFEEIGNVAAAGTSQEMLEYSFFDAQLPQGNVYYRLVQFDFNGEYEIFDPIVLNTAGDQGRIHVTPNPGVDQVTVTLPAGTTGGELIILDLAGKEVYNATVDASAKNASVEVDVTSLPKGLYYVRYGNAREGFSSQLLQLL